MPFHEIPRRRWAQFLDDFSRQHCGRECSLEVDSSIAGSELEAHRSPFEGVAFEPGAAGPRIQVFVGAQPDSHVTHEILRPSAIWVEETDDGGQKGLRIEADEGSIVLRFRSSGLPAYVERFLP